MSRGEFLTRASIWLALGAYGVAAGTMLARPGPRGMPPARLAWTLGCAFFVVHVICAFHFYHGWSHAAAYRETARQTAEMTGWRWGGGLYWNYVFAAAWLLDAVWWWWAPARHAARSSWLSALWHGFFFFMVFNGTVIFGHGPVRWFGSLICTSLAVLGGWQWHRWIARGAAGG